MEPEGNGQESTLEPAKKIEKVDMVRKIALLVILAILAVYVVMIGASTIRYMKTVSEMSEVLRVVPIEEQWPAPSQEKLSLGYAKLAIPPDAIEKVIATETVVAVQLLEGLAFLFGEPLAGTIADEYLSDEKVGQMKLIDAEIALRFAQDFTWRKDASLLQPKGVLAFALATGKEERRPYLAKLQEKGANVLNQNGIIIFEAPQVQGILRRGNREVTQMLAHVWRKGGGIVQSVLIGKGGAQITAADEQGIRQMLASMEFTIDEPIDREQLARLLTEAAQVLPGYVPPEAAPTGQPEDANAPIE